MLNAGQIIIPVPFIVTKRYFLFPGNVRELENLIERSVAISSTSILLPDSLALSVRKRRWIEGVQGCRFDLDGVKKGVLIDEILARIEKAYILKALESAGMNKSRAAELLGINLSRVLKNKNQAVRQGARRCDKRSIYQAYVSIGESRATLHGGLRRSFSTACQVPAKPAGQTGRRRIIMRVTIFVRPW